MENNHVDCNDEIDNDNTNENSWRSNQQTDWYNFFYNHKQYKIVIIML
jgi:hypothetical protein